MVVPGRFCRAHEQRVHLGPLVRLSRWIGDQDCQRRIPPPVAMMQSANPRQRSQPCPGRRTPLDLPWRRRLFSETAVRAVIVVVRDILTQQAA